VPALLSADILLFHAARPSRGNPRKSLCGVAGEGKEGEASSRPSPSNALGTGFLRTRRQYSSAQDSTRGVIFPSIFPHACFYSLNNSSIFPLEICLTISEYGTSARMRKSNGQEIVDAGPWKIDRFAA
jgi:hypothetical protein